MPRGFVCFLEVVNEVITVVNIFNRSNEVLKLIINMNY